MVNLPNTYEGHINLFLNLKKRYSDTRKELNYREGDVRRWTLKEIETLCDTIGFVPLVLNHSFEISIPERKLDLTYMLALDEPHMAQSLLDSYGIRAKASLLTMIQFVVENCFATLLEQLDFQSEGKISKDASKLLHHTQIQNAQEKLKKLNTAANLRNCLHRDGVHVFEDETIEINEVKYEFVRNKQVNCAGWGHIFHLYFHLHDIYKEIFLSQKIKQFDFIPRVNGMATQT